MAAVSSSTSTAYLSSQLQLPTSTTDPTADADSSSLVRKPRRSSSFVMVEASSASVRDGGVARTKSLTEDDLEELKGCLDLGFGFAYSEIPELCGTLPALELCYSMTRRFLDEQRSPGQEQEEEPASPPLPNWRISGPGDDPEEVKARLKYWAQAVACTVKLCRLKNLWLYGYGIRERIILGAGASALSHGSNMSDLICLCENLGGGGGIMIRNSDRPRLRSMV